MDRLDVLPDEPPPRHPPAAAARGVVCVPARLRDRAVALRLAHDPDSRERAALELGARITGQGADRRATHAACPSCGVVVYASAPVMAVVGTFEVREVVRRSPREVWADHQDELGIAEGPYFDYFEGAGTAHAIAIGRVKRIAPVTLAALRERVPGFRPPQSYMMWTGDVDILTNAGVVSAAAAK